MGMFKYQLDQALDMIKKFKEKEIIEEAVIGVTQKYNLYVLIHKEREDSFYTAYFKVKTKDGKVARIKFSEPAYIIHYANSSNNLSLNKKQCKELDNLLSLIWIELIKEYNRVHETTKYENYKFKNYIKLDPGNMINNFIPLDSPKPDYTKLI